MIVPAVGYKTVHTGNMAINSAAARRAGQLPADRLLLPGLQIGREVVDALHRDPKGETTGNLEVRPNSQALQIEHDASGKVTAVVYADKNGKQSEQKARVVAVAGNSIESPRLLLNSRVDHVPGRLGQFVRPDRPERHAPHDGQRLCRIRQTGAHVSRHHHGRHHP